MAEFFCEELNKLDERIEENQLSFIDAGRRNSQVSIESQKLVQRPKNATDRLFNLSYTVLANINAGMMLKPSKNNKLYETLVPPVNPLLSRIGAKVDCSAPEAFRMLLMDDLSNSRVLDTET